MSRLACLDQKMDFKTRFQGKTSKITKDGGIEGMIRDGVAPINKVDQITINNFNAHKQLVSYPASA